MLLIEDLERYIYDKDTKKIAENKAVRELFCLPSEGQGTAADYGTGRLRFAIIFPYL